MLENDDRELMRTVARYLEQVNRIAASEQRDTLTPVGERIAAHLGADPLTVPIVTESFADHRLVDADIALDELAAAGGGELLGISGGDGRFHASMSELVANPHFPWGLGAVSFVSRATGPDTAKQVVGLGVRLLAFDGHPIALTQRAANPQYGRNAAEVEVMGADVDVVARFLVRLRELMVARSVMRGKVLSFVRTEYGSEAGATFLVRPDVHASAIVLEDGVLDEIVAHVVGIGEQSEALLAAGQHLKRGVLLYGPPGTGKTLTIRHLLHLTPGVTAVLLTGSSIAAIGAAAEIARTFQPSIVVLEDIDLVAMERHSSPQPLLFEVLDALDGLDGDADVAFVMTTNRVSVLERALADRPGRVDLAVEIPLPGADERVRLFTRYASELPYSHDALVSAASAAEGTTGSFAKELMRRSVLLAALEGREPDDQHLDNALSSLLSARSTLTRKLLGSTSDTPSDVDIIDDGSSYEGVTTGWTAYTPMSGSAVLSSDNDFDEVSFGGADGSPPESDASDRGER